MHIQIENGTSNKQWVVFENHNGEPKNVRIFKDWNKADHYAICQAAELDVDFVDLADPA